MVLHGVTAKHRLFALHTADDGRSILRSAVFWTNEQGFVHFVASCKQDDVDAVRHPVVAQSSPFTSLTECLMDGFKGGRLRAIASVVAVGRDIDIAC